MRINIHWPWTPLDPNKYPWYWLIWRTFWMLLEMPIMEFGCFLVLIGGGWKEYREFRQWRIW